VKEDADAAYELRGRLDWRVEADLAARSAYWNKYDGKVSKAAASMNNTYLMAMSQTQGVKSYGMVVDLLIADYVSRNGNPDLT
jgi:putative heme iron utilization protein